MVICLLLLIRGRLFFKDEPECVKSVHSSMCELQLKDYRVIRQLPRLPFVDIFLSCFA